MADSEIFEWQRMLTLQRRCGATTYHCTASRQPWCVPGDILEGRYQMREPELLAKEGHCSLSGEGSVLPLQHYFMTHLSFGP